MGKYTTQNIWDALVTVLEKQGGVGGYAATTGVPVTKLAKAACCGPQEAIDAILFEAGRRQVDVVVTRDVGTSPEDPRNLTIVSIGSGT